MHKLRQYVDLIQQFKVKKQEIRAIMGDEKTKLYRFFEGLAAHRWKDDENAAVRELYGETFDTKYTAYRALKTELKKKLKSLLLLIDFKQPDLLNEYQQANYEIFRTEAAIKILVGRGKMDAAVDLAQHLLETALKFEATSQVIFAAKHLRNYYRYLSPNEKKYEYYHKLHDEYFEYYRLESLAESYYCDIIGHFVNNRAAKKWLVPIVQDYVSKLLPHKETVKTTQFSWFLGLLEILSHMIALDYRTTLTVCDAYIGEFERKPFPTEHALITLYHQKQVCHLMLREYENCWETAQKTAQWVIEGSHNWFKDHTLFVQLCLHTGRNQEALKAFIKIFKHDALKNQSESVQEELRIYHGYIQWLIAVGKIKPTKVENQQIGPFSAIRFSNGIPIFSQDKQGLNIPILVLQILWMVHLEDNTGFIKRLDALRKHKNRYLKDEAHAQTHLLLKLFALAPELDYDAKKIKEKAATIDPTLINTTNNTPSGTHEIEVFSYDMYRLYFLELLEKRGKKRKKSGL